jgi:O-antigen/teichoic acid export membrane protein
MIKKTLKANSIWNTSSHFFGVASLLFLFPFLITNIGAEKYGFFIFLSTINGIASVANFGFGEATLRFVALYYKKDDIPTIKKILTTSLFIYVIIGALLASIIYLLAPQISELLKEKSIDSQLAIYLIKVSITTFIIRFTFGIFAMVPQAIERFDISSKITIIETTLRVALYVLVIFKGYGLIGLVYCEFILALIYVVLNYIVSATIFKKVWFLGRFSKEIFKEMFSYSIYSGSSQIIGLLWQYSDRILLGYFIGTSAIAYFSVPQQIIFKILGLISAGAAVLFPKFSVEIINNDIKLIFKKFTLLLLSISIVSFAVLSLIMPEFLTLWISAEFAEEAKDIAIILAISCMIRGAAPVYMNLFKGIGKPVYNLYAIISSSLIIVILNFILIPIYGINGAGIAYLFSPLPMFLIFYLIYTRMFNESAKEAIVLFVVPLLLGYSLLTLGLMIKSRVELPINWISLFSQLILYTSIFSIMLFFYFTKIIKGFNNIILDFNQLKKDFFKITSKIIKY